MPIITAEARINLTKAPTGSVASGLGTMEPRMAETVTRSPTMATMRPTPGPPGVLKSSPSAGRDCTFQ